MCNTIHIVSLMHVVKKTHCLQCHRSFGSLRIIVVTSEAQGVLTFAR